jgi:hypothetical protein
MPGSAAAPARHIMLLVCSSTAWSVLQQGGEGLLLHMPTRLPPSCLRTACMPALHTLACSLQPVLYCYLARSSWCSPAASVLTRSSSLNKKVQVDVVVLRGVN